jgi:hypothetical protein
MVITRKTKMPENLSEKSVSKAQQMFFGMVHKCQKTGDCASPQVAKVAAKMKHKDAEDFARTKHKGLPKRKKFKEFLLEKHPTWME